MTPWERRLHALLKEAPPSHQGEPPDHGARASFDVGEVDRTQVITDIQSMEQIVAEELSPWRFMTQILGTLAGIAIAPAVIGT